MSDGITDAAKQTREALEHVRRKAEKEMSEQPKEYIITDEQLQKISFDYVSNIRDPCTTVHDRAAYVDTIRSRPHPAPRPPCEECIYQAQAAKAQQPKEQPR